MGESAVDKASREFVEWWFGKQPDETLGEAMTRVVMQPHGVFEVLRKYIDIRANHDPGDEDRT